MISKQNNNCARIRHTLLSISLRSLRNYAVKWSLEIEWRPILQGQAAHFMVYFITLAPRPRREIFLCVFHGGR